MSLSPRSLSLGAAVGALWLAAIPVRAADVERGLPLVQHFEEGAVLARGPVLSFAQAADGTVFVGSNQLSAFDGRIWEKIELPRAYAFRALAAAPSSAGAPRVWVGARGALGYVERNTAGVWRFTSLSQPLEAAGVSDPGDVWWAQASERGAVFVTSQRVLRWDGARFDVWTLPSALRLHGFAGREGRTWIFQPGVGLLRLDPGGAPLLAHPATRLPPAPIVWLAEQASASGGPPGLLLVTNEGVYNLDTHGSEELPEVSAVVRGNFPESAAELDADTIAIGTFEAGLIIASRAGRVLEVIDSARGLPGENVHSLWRAASGGIWIGLGNGFARIDALGTALLFDRRDGLGEGAPRRVVAHQGGIYVLTDKELFRAAEPVAQAAGNAPLVPIVRRQPLLRDLASADGQLWLSGFGGIWLVTPQGHTRVHQAPADIPLLCPLQAAPGVLLFAEDYALKELAPDARNASWSARDLGVRLNDLPSSLVEDAGGEVWVSTVLDGIHRFRREVAPDEPPRLHPLGHYKEGHGLPGSAARPVLAEVGPHVLAFTEGGILRFDRERNAFLPEPGFQDLAGVAAAAAGPRAAYWIVRSRSLGDNAPYALLRVESTSTGLTWQALRAPGLGATGEIARLDVAPDASGPALWVAGGRALLRLDPEKFTSPAGAPTLALQHVRTNSGTPVAPLASATPVAFGADLRRVAFQFAARDAVEGEPVFYQTRLRNVEAGWSPPQRDPGREFTGLAPGDYTFMARAIDRFGRAGSAVTYRFRITPPWYERKPALIAYLALAGLLVAGVVRWRVRRLEREAEKLNRLVAERTRHLDLVNTAKSEFLENISHEIRNPLNGIVGLANMFKEERLAPAERELARSLKASAEHLRFVSEQVLDFTKLEYGEPTIETKPFALERLMEGVADLYRLTARQHGNTLQVELPENCRQVFVGDVGKIRTIVGNFVSNALKYAPGTLVVLRAECEAADDETANLILSVTDHGPGVPLEEQELIFQKFVRGQEAKSQRVAGTGIGLAACRLLARALGGSVGVESPSASAAESSSQPGATFHLWLPVRRAPASALAPELAPGGSALIVEDEEYNRIVLRGTVEMLGYRAKAAADAPAALALLEDESFDVLLLDWELPGGAKGPDIARRVRARAGGERPVILAVTAHHSEEVRQRCREAGMDGFLIKPVDTAEVGRAIADALAARAGRPGESPKPAERVVEDRIRELAEPETFDLSAIEMFARHASEHGNETRQRFVDALERELTAIERAVEAGNRDNAGMAAHRLRALAALVKATRLNQTAQRLEEQARDDTADLVPLWRDVHEAGAALKAAVLAGS